MNYESPSETEEGNNMDSKPEQSILDPYESSSEDEEGKYNSDFHQPNEKLEQPILDPKDKGTKDNWIQRNTSMIRLTGNHPFNSEPPLNDLMRHGFITPVPLHYVRNHDAVPNGKWDTWTVEICGLVKNPRKFTMEQLVNEFSYAEFPVTLVCAGNRRKEQNMVKQTIGFNWGAAGVSTSVWRGVRLRHVLKKCGIYRRKKGALAVCFESVEDLSDGGGSKYGTSLRKEVAMDPARDIILAYKQNGELLHPDHGFPVRMIIPGCIGGRMVKWLAKIEVTEQESQNDYHFNDNRVLPSYVDAKLAKSQDWSHKSEHIINELNVNSVITTPSHDEILQINSATAQRPYTLKGYAYSGGGKKVTRVEVTLDNGENWLDCTLEHPEKPNKYGKYWCWCFWSLQVEVFDLIRAKEIAVRAWDETHNTQPEKLIWNLMGMMNNCWFRVKTNMCKPHEGEIGLVFEHPTLAGDQSGGWMARMKRLESSETQSTMKTSVRVYLQDVQNHNSAESAWIIVHGQVYDCTQFLNDHPGGDKKILEKAGSDCTEAFDKSHDDDARRRLEKYRIAELINGGYTSDSSDPPLIPRKRIPVRLVKKTNISDTGRIFRFALPSDNQGLVLPVGKHIFLCATIHGKECERAYTPTSTMDELGHFELVVKVYLKNKVPDFPDGGLMSQYLDSLPEGSMLDIKGPFGNIEYLGCGKFKEHDKIKFGKKLAMLAGGTGITPIYQVMQAILKDPEDKTEMYVVYANRTEDDILLRKQLDSWEEEYKKRLKVWYVVEIKPDGKDWKYSEGLITEEILKNNIPPGSKDTLALACGPPTMIESATPNLEKLNYDVKKTLLVF